jgi:glycosyltransferase involved in cell wall biosynthesis
MKVLHVLSELQFSGAELMLYTAADKFKQASLDITILSTGEKEGVYAQYFKKVGWKVIHIPFRKRVSFFVTLYKLVRKEKYDVVHIHTEGAFIYKAFTIHLAGTKKIVSTVHNNFLFGTYLTRRRKLHHYLALKLLNVKFTAISESVQDTEQNIYNTNTTLIHNWIDIDKFKRKDEGLQEASFSERMAKPRFVSVGKCITIKNHQAILELIKTLVHRNIQCHYVHIGCGELEEQEKQWVKDNHLQPYVTFISYTDRVADYMATCDFYLMPSSVEGLGNACLEAMAAGLFCIVNDAPNLNTLVDHERTGLVVDFSQTEQVANCIVEVCSDTEKYRRVVKKAQEFVAGKFSLSNVDQMIEIYS